MNCTADLARIARKIKAAWMRQDSSGGGAIWCPWHKMARRLRFLRWALAVQILKGAGDAGGAIAIQIIAARFFMR